MASNIYIFFFFMPEINFRVQRPNRQAGILGTLAAELTLITMDN